MLMHSELSLLSSGWTEIILKLLLQTFFSLLFSSSLVLLFGFFQILLNSASQLVLNHAFWPCPNAVPCWLLLSVISSVCSLGILTFCTYWFCLWVNILFLNLFILSHKGPHIVHPHYTYNSAVLWGNAIDVSIAATSVVCLLFHSAYITILESHSTTFKSNTSELIYFSYYFHLVAFCITFRKFHDCTLFNL